MQRMLLKCMSRFRRPPRQAAVHVLEMEPLHDLIPAPFPQGYGRLWQGPSPRHSGSIPGEVGHCAVICLTSTDVTFGRELLDGGAIADFIHYDLADDAIETIPTDTLISMVDRALAHLSAGTDLYVHCWAGISRSSYFSIALLMRHFDWSFPEALEFVEAHRRCADPNPTLKRHLSENEETIRRERCQDGRRLVRSNCRPPSP